MMTRKLRPNHVNASLKLTPEERSAIARLLASAVIGRAPRVRAVLAYLLDRVEEGRLDEITESRIGEAVFGRSPGYNASEDNIVRVTVRHLRERLERYYETEGAQEKWMVSIPKGKYLPVLTIREETETALEFLPPASFLAPRAGSALISRPMVQIGLVILLLGNVVLGYLLLVQQAGGNGGLIGHIFEDRTQPVFIIGSDADLQAYRQIFQHTVSLQSYLDRSYLQERTGQAEPLKERVWHFIGTRKDTTMSTARAAVDLEKALTPRAIVLRHPRDCTIRDFERENVILLGGPWINPWGQLFEDRLNFRVVPPESNASGSEIVNLKPEGNEPRVYRTHKEGAYSISYVRLAMIPDARTARRAVLVGANSEEAVEAGAAFLVSGSARGELLRRAHATAVKALPSFEIVLEVKGLESTARQFEIVAYRTIAN